MTDRTCTVLTGLPACGKSTRVASLLFGHGAVDRPFVYSTDNLIDEWAADDGKTYNEVFNDLISSATNTMDRLLEDAIHSGRDIIWDQTNTGAKKRLKIIRRMKNAGYRVECECIQPPFSDDEVNEWLTRLKSRPGKTIPDHVMSSMMENYTIPTVDEGFDAVHIFDMYGNKTNTTEV